MLSVVLIMFTIAHIELTLCVESARWVQLCAETQRQQLCNFLPTQIRLSATGAVRT